MYEAYPQNKFRLQIFPLLVAHRLHALRFWLLQYTSEIVLTHTVSGNTGSTSFRQDPNSSADEVHKNVTAPSPSCYSYSSCVPGTGKTDRFFVTLTLIYNSKILWHVDPLLDNDREISTILQPLLGNG
jgi:hypothetical protein